LDKVQTEQHRLSGRREQEHANQADQIDEAEMEDTNEKPESNSDRGHEQSDLGMNAESRNTGGIQDIRLKRQINTTTAPPQ